MINESYNQDNSQAKEIEELNKQYLKAKVDKITIAKNEEHIKVVILESRLSYQKEKNKKLRART